MSVKTFPDHVLLVTDIPDHVVSYQAALNRAGFRVHVARSGKEAITFAAGHVPDCVVIDLRLPDLSGWELCTRLKTDARLDATPVVILTPDVSGVYAQQGAAVGCHAWLARPTLGDDLARTVRMVLDQDAGVPKSQDAALLGDIPCPACTSRNIRAGLRMAFIQNYRCVACGFQWRVEAV